MVADPNDRIFLSLLELKARYRWFTDNKDNFTKPELIELLEILFNGMIEIYEVTEKGNREIDKALEEFVKGTEK